jgi:hypothetical protein
MKRRKTKKARKKYLTGTAVTDYMEDPSTELAQNQINISQAKYESESNPWHMGLQAVGGMLTEYGMGMVEDGGGFGEAFKDAKGKVGNLFKKKSSASGRSQRALGGKVNEVPVEVEGGEMLETPKGQVSEVVGPKHSNGGVDADLEEGTMVYSDDDRLKIDGKTPAQRKKRREARMNRMRKRLEEAPNDRLLRNAAEREQLTYDQEEKEDIQLQELVSSVDAITEFARYGTGKNGVRKKYNKGTPWGGVASTDTEEEEESGNIPWSFGDIVGAIGTAQTAFSPYLVNEQQRGSDTPNINAWEGAGEDALKANTESQAFLKQQQDNALKNIELGATTARKSVRNKVRSVNTLNAMDFGVSSGYNKAVGDIYAGTGKAMSEILGKRSVLENQQDQMVMKGEYLRDDADRRDKDKYYESKAQALVDMGEGVQKFGKDFNTRKQDEEFLDMMPDLNKWGLTWKKVDGKWQVVSTGKSKVE